MAVGEIILTAFITVLFEKLSSSELLNFARREGIDTQLKKWSEMLATIEDVLGDAEDKQITERAVKRWLEFLTDLAYDLDDVVDDLATVALRRELMMAEPQASTSNKVWKFIPTCCTNYYTTPSAVKVNDNMKSKIEEITSRLQDIETQKNVLDLKVNILGGVRSNNTVREMYLPTTSLVDESSVYGREKDKEAILKLLLRGESSDENVSVIPILGMGGVGKTTLAQLVYNDVKVKARFDLKAWACVSDDFDVFGVTKTILDSLITASEIRDLKDLNMLQVKLKENLTGKKFLLVLDDIWNEDYHQWEVLCRPFQVGAPGSKIIVTTRNQKVASITSFTPPYQVKELSKDDCLSLFAQHSLGRRNFDSHPNLKEIGEGIVKKCQGLPLAAKTLGGLLRTKMHQNEWEDILNSNIWDLPQQKGGIIPALQLSYHHLPSHLKRCFAYCSIFTKDYEFDKDELVLLWMAEGFLQQSKGKKRMEDFGRECFDDLLSRSFFQQSSGKESHLLFVMHDLINDLAQFVAPDICFRLEELEGSEQYKISKRARHASYVRQKYEVFPKFKFFYKVERLRTFLPLPVQQPYLGQCFYLSNKVLVDLLPKLQCLRVLSLSGYSISELPDSIGDLKHLRYLNLSETWIKWLPESVSTLYNLQTLLLRNCHALRKLPSSIGNLTNLRHLDIIGTTRLEEMPPGIGKLTSLQTLSKFVVGKISGLGLIELKHLLFLCGKLSIAGLQNVTNLGDAMEANLTCNEGLDEIGLGWSSEFDDSRNEILEMGVLDVLKPHKNLERLEIEFYGGMKFPSWIGDPSFSQIENLTLSYCEKCTSLPPLGQLPMLKDLHVRGMHKVKSVGVEFYGDGCASVCSFPSLETLMFADMPEWEEWASFTAGQFSCLRELTIHQCPKLTRVPPLRPPSLCKLDLQECDEVVLKSVADLPSLTHLRIYNIKELTYLHEEFMQFLVALKVLQFYNCDKLVKLWVTGENVEREEGLPRNLEVLYILSCGNLEKLPNGLNNLTSLRDLTISNCPKLVYFPETGVPPMLRRLDIRSCNALESLPNNISHLQQLVIHECSSLRSLGAGELPTTLETLQISNCMHLEWASTLVDKSSTSLVHLRTNYWPYSTVTSLRSFQHNFPSLVELSISDCHGLESFPERGLPAPNLRELRIRNCPILKSLPDQIQSLTSLEILSICNCPSLDSFPKAKGDLPPNLTRLQIKSCQKLKPLSEWGLHRLTSLRRFSMRDVYPELVSFHPDNDNEYYCVLPATLTVLVIEELENLESLSSKGLQNLTSLQELDIRRCPKLRSLPKDGLLATLSRLEIWECPLLKQRCLKEKGEYWLKNIADIPCVLIHGRLFHL